MMLAPPVSPYRLLRRYLLPQWRPALWMTILLLAAIAFQLANPQVLRYFLDTAQSGGATERLLRAALLFILFALLQQVLKLAANYISQQVSWSATNRLRADLARHCLKLDLSFHKRYTPGELIERIDGDVTQLANFFSQFVVVMLANALLVLGILVLLLREDIGVGLGMTAYTLLVLLALGRIQRLAVPYWKAERQASAELYGFLEERISGVEDIRVNGAEEYMLQRLFRLMRTLLEKGRAAWVVSSLASSSTNLLYVIGYTIGLAVGVYLYSQGRATIGAAYLILHYIEMLAEPLQTIRQQAQDLQQASASSQRIQELLGQQSRMAEPRRSEARHLPPGALSVVFEGVSFRYDDNENVLHEVSFDLQPGRVLGILGRTGSGKSTLTRLLFRLYDPGEGAIRLGGADLRQVPLPELRQRVGLVTQDVQLFQASVRHNLSFFNHSLPEEHLVRALQDVQLWDWVRALPQGLDSVLGASGQGLSAGEAQLLAFARVLLKNPGLVILDEASSRLDPATETRIERAIDRLFSGRTGLVIAHRLRTVQRADDILILEAGRVIEYGSRQALAGDPHSHFYHLLQTGLEKALA